MKRKRLNIRLQLVRQRIVILQSTRLENVVGGISHEDICSGSLVDNCTGSHKVNCPPT